MADAAAAPGSQAPTIDAQSNAVAAKTWPELVGLTAEVAKKKLESEDPSLNVEAVPYGELRKVIPDKANTVRLWLDADGLVYIVPTIAQPQSSATTAASTPTTTTSVPAATTAETAAPTTGTSAPKTWPELVGLPGEEASKKLEAEDPSLTVDIVTYGELRPQAADPKTVRLWLDASGLVYIVPALQS